jgi:hypothetical protein
MLVSAVWLAMVAACGAEPELATGGGRPALAGPGDSPTAPAQPAPQAASAPTAMPLATPAKMAAPVSSVDLEQCAPADCASLAGAMAPVQSVDNANAPLCPLAAALPLVSRWQAPARQVACDAPQPCDVGASHIAASPDGSLWVVGGFRPSSENPEQSATGVIVMRHDAEGQLLGERIIQRDPLSGNRGYALAIIVDARGHAFVGATITEYDAYIDGEPTRSESWIEEFDAQLEPVGERVAIAGSVEAGTPLLGSGDEDSLTVALSPGYFQTLSGDEARPGVAVLDRDRTLRWSRDRAGSWAATSLVADSNGNVTLQGRRSPRGRAMEQYGRDGSLTRIFAFSDVLRDPFITGDAQSNLVRTGYIGGYQDSVNLPIYLVAQKLGPDGQPIWLSRVEIPEGVGDGAELGRYGTGLQQPIVDPSGTVFIPGGASKQDGMWSSNVYEFGPDGQRCVRHALQGTSDGFIYVDQLASGPNGELYYCVPSYGRFER